MARLLTADSNGSKLEVAVDLAGLDSLDLDCLRSRWLKVTGKPAPRAFRRKLLISALAYEIQVAAYGGLPDG